MEHPSNGAHKSSMLLTKDENERIFQLLRPNSQSIATTVVQMYSTDGPAGADWIKRCVGILCLVRDVDMRSYFFRLFCLVQNEMIWEHEIYNRIQYQAPTSFLHTFEAEDCIVAFNFANEKEAALLREKVLTVSFDNLNTAEFEVRNEDDKSTIFQLFDGVLGNEHKLILQFFDEVRGISEKQLKDEKNHESSRTPSPLPSRTQRDRHLRPPALPSTPRPRSQEKTNPEYPDVVLTVPISPPPLMTPPPPPVPPRTSPINFFFSTPVEVETKADSISKTKTDNPRGDLLSEIRKGIKLKTPVEVETKADSGKSRTDNPRGDLLSEIRKGIKLKAVQTNTKQTQNTLTRALAERFKAIQSDSSDTSEASDADDDGWDD